MLRSSSILFICIAAMQLLHPIHCLPPPEMRAHLEAKVISSMSLKDLERMVENDERVLNAPRPPLVVIPKARASSSPLDEEEPKVYIIHRKAPQQQKKKAYGFSDREFFDDVLGRSSSFEPRYRFESAFKLEEEFPALFGGEMQSAGSNPVKSFYEAIVEKSVAQQRDPFAILEAAASRDLPSYKPRFDYESYSKDPTEVKLKGKKYWRDAPERRDDEDATVDENGCRTVVKKVSDPESGKAPTDGEDAKSIIITKECEYPNLNGPEAKIPEMEPHLKSDGSELSSDYDNSEPPRYLNTRPVELDLESDAKTSDPLGPDYIDRMLESHFKSFPGYSNPLSSFKGYQDRFKLSAPSGSKDIKPAVKVESYDYSHPKSGFESDRQVEYSNKEAPQRYRQFDYDNERTKDQGPVNYNNRGHREYDYVDQKSPRKPAYGDREPHYHYDQPEKKASDYDEDKIRKENPKEKKAPKMMKKSFAYYRKDKPKEDPNDQHYAEEYAQGNYRSFSSDYDSERDGPKKQ